MVIASQLSAGDRVKIIGRGHPWRGHAGTVVVAPREMKLFGSIPGTFLEVEIDDQSGHRAGCTLSDVRKVRE